LSSNRPGVLGGNDLYRIYTLPLKKKKHNAAPKQEELFIYTAKGDEIKISGASKENLKFDFQPGQKYNLVVEYDNSRTGTTQSIKNATSFTKLNVYTFDIQKSSEAVYDQKSKSKQVQDLHINPGDLVTFQLIPNMVQDPDADVSKIQFQKSEAIITDGQSIVFSYVAEGGPGEGLVEDDGRIGGVAIRRLGRRALCLCPNTAVPTQWVQQWSDFAPAVTQMGSAPSLDAPLTVLTYQSMCSLDTEQSSVEAHALDLWRRALEQRDGLPPDVAEATVNRLRKASLEQIGTDQSVQLLTSREGQLKQEMSSDKEQLDEILQHPGAGRADALLAPQPLQQPHERAPSQRLTLPAERSKTRGATCKAGGPILFRL